MVKTLKIGDKIRCDDVNYYVAQHNYKNIDSQILYSLQTKSTYNPDLCYICLNRKISLDQATEIASKVCKNPIYFFGLVSHCFPDFVTLEDLTAFLDAIIGLPDDLQLSIF